MLISMPIYRCTFTPGVNFVSCNCASERVLKHFWRYCDSFQTVFIVKTWMK